MVSKANKSAEFSGKHIKANYKTDSKLKINEALLADTNSKYNKPQEIKNLKINWYCPLKVEAIFGKMLFFWICQTISRFIM